MTLKILSNKKVLRSSSDQKSIFSEPIIYHENGIKIDFIIDKLPTLLEFEKSYPEYLSQIKRDLNIKKSLLNYTNIEGLKLYTFESGSYLAVIAAGEYQPSLYKALLEVVYEKRQ